MHFPVGSAATGLGICHAHGTRLDPPAPVGALPARAHITSASVSRPAGAGIIHRPSAMTPTPPRRVILTAPRASCGPQRGDCEAGMR